VAEITSTGQALDRLFPLRSRDAFLVGFRWFGPIWDQIYEGILSSPNSPSFDDEAALCFRLWNQSAGRDFLPELPLDVYLDISHLMFAPSKAAESQRDAPHTDPNLLTVRSLPLPQQRECLQKTMFFQRQPATDAGPVGDGFTIGEDVLGDRCFTARRGTL